MLRHALFICVLLGSLISTSTPSSDLAKEQEVLSSIEETYLSDHRAFAKELGQLVDDIQSGDTVNMRNRFVGLRLRYKRIEPLFAYFEEEGVLRWINGAPLPKPDPVSPQMEVLHPKGLQTAEEAICSGDFKEGLKLLLELKKNFSRLTKFESARSLQHRYVFEALRLQVIRIYTLSLTGFDTPLCSDGLNEAMVSIDVMAEYMATYTHHSPNKDVRLLAKELHALLLSARRYMDNYEFEDLPRLELYRAYLMPIYKGIYEMHKISGADFRDEVDRTSKAFNYDAQNLYDSDFFYPGFFAKIADSDLGDPLKIELGKTLFYDPALSSDLTMSCATCHRPDRAYTDGHSLTPTRDQHTTTRNSPTLINAVIANKYFWDLREYDLERQIKHVIYDHNEFNMDFIALADRLKGSNGYVDMFSAAYGERDRQVISTWSISNALAAYVSSLTSHNSPFDLYARSESSSLDPSAIRGHDLFMGKASCGTCHFAPTFAGVVPPTWRDTESEVLGVLTVHDTLNPQLDMDAGRAANATKRDDTDFYVHSMKTVTVRNAELTAPYFHHGGYQSLEDVLDFYDRGGGAGMGLDVPHQTLPSDPLGLTEEEKRDIIAFIHALTDTAGLYHSAPDLPRFEDHVEWEARLSY